MFVLVCKYSYQPEDGAGPSIATQLALNPFAAVIRSDAIKLEHGGVSALGQRTLLTTFLLLTARDGCNPHFTGAHPNRLEINS